MHDVNTTVFIQQGLNIQTKLNQAIFSGVVPTTAEVTAVLQQLLAADLACLERNYSQIPLRKSLKREATNLLLMQCDSVNVIAQGDIEVLQSSGFEIAKTRSPRPLPEKGLLPLSLQVPLPVMPCSDTEASKTVTSIR